MSAWISLPMLTHRFFIFEYAVEMVMGSIRKPSELLDKNSSVSNMCFRHLFFAAVCKEILFGLEFYFSLYNMHVYLCNNT